MDIEKSDAKYFIVLFTDRLQYRAIYTIDHSQDTQITDKLCGVGPAQCTLALIKQFYKYDFGQKAFSPVTTKHFGNTIDGFSINENYWHKAKQNKSNTPTGSSK